jgi:D-beta-D-heptose 7-phosphate kinase/D-beta-D-heptose 1-phosphate adenosyltransferase
MTGLDAGLIARLAGVRVLVVGDAMLDEYLEGEAERISPEAPVPVVRVRGAAAQPGGAANVARNAAALGAAVELVAVVGADPAGEQLAALCGRAGVGTGGLVRAARRPTTRKQRVLARGQQVLRVDWEETGPLGPRDVRALLDRVAAAPAPDVLVLSDYAKGALEPAVLAAALARARASRAPAVVDPKNPDLARYRGATVLTPNRREFAAALGVTPEVAVPDRIGALGRPMLDRLAVDHLVVTCGADGLVVVSAEQVEVVPAVRRHVADITGAGDTVAAVLALALGAGADIGRGARLANAAAGLVVEKVGTAVVGPEELARAVAAPPPDRILSRSALGARVARWRAAGARVTFTNGCFDLLHAGHLALLNAARRPGHVLVVGLNGDASVTRLKGPGRPVVPEAARAAMLAALDAVDAVVVFDEDTPLDLIRDIRPDVLVKGADYAPDQVVGHELVLGWGGEVVLVPLVPGLSTTALVAQVRRGAALRR